MGSEGGPYEAAGGIGGFDAEEEEEEKCLMEIIDMGHFEEGNEDDSDSVDEDHFDEFEDDEEMVNIPLINTLNSNFG
jgi:hypothetical protein